MPLRFETRSKRHNKSAQALLGAARRARRSGRETSLEYVMALSGSGVPGFQNVRIHGSNYTKAWIDEALFESKKTLWVSARGSIIIDVSMVYLQGEAFVLLQVKYTSTLGGIAWKKEYIKVPRPHNKKERQELLRNMATMHAMKLGYPHKLRSKV